MHSDGCLDPVHQLERERERLQDLAQALQSERASSDALFRQLEAAQRSERRALADARQAASRAEKLLRQLPFRLGSTMVASLRCPSRWWRLPLDLLRTVRAYRIDKAAGVLATPPPTDDLLTFRKGRLAIVLSSRWQSLRLPDSETPIDVWATPVCSPAQEPALVSVWGSEPIGRQGAQPINADSIDVSLTQATPIMLLRHQGSAVRIRLRHAGGSKCLLNLELRRVGIAEHEAGLPLRANEESADLDPRPVANAILWQASQIASEGDLDRAIRFATRHARAFVRPAVSLLKANRASDEREWLQHLNDYVRQFGIAPIELADRPASLFDRLRSGDLARIERGPLVSIIMPVFQAEQTVCTAVRSILDQTWRPLELIIVDDCSTDRTPDLLRELAAGDARVKLLRNEVNVGPYVSKNLALALARGEFVTGHDADDWAHPQRLERHLAEVLGSGGRIKASMTRMLRLDEHGHFVHFAREGKASDDGALRDAAISCLFDTAFLRRDLGHWDSVRFGADSELISRARLVCGDGFVNLRQLSMLCLDTDFGLTNDPEHGVSKRHGVSPIRAQYRDRWSAWQRGLSAGGACLAFPHHPRRFEAPEALIVPPELIGRVRASVGARSTYDPSGASGPVDALQSGRWSDGDR